MRSKNSSQHTAAESAHLALVKSCPCSVTGAAPPSEAHHIRQGDHFTAVAVSWDAHRGPQGIHGDKSLWRLAKLDELAALNITLRNVDALRNGKPIQQKPRASRQNSTRTPSKIFRGFA